MQINKIEQLALLRAKELRGKPFPVLGSMIRGWKAYLLLSGICAGYFWLAFSLGIREASFIAVGLLIGILARDIGWFRLHARMWPVNQEITDWDKVDRLLEQRADSAGR